MLIKRAGIAVGKRLIDLQLQYSVTKHIAVVEYPKSGGTWLCSLLSDLYGLRFAHQTVIPPVLPSVVHTHKSPPFKNGTNVVYLCRDGRDVMVSYYFHRINGFGGPYNSQLMKWKKKVFGADADLNDVQRYLPRFISEELTNPSFGLLSWPQHVDRWKNHASTCFIRYEDLLSNPVRELECANESLPCDPKMTFSSAVENNTLAKMRQRAPSASKSFFRSGTAGGWVNYFTPEAIEIFNFYCEETMKSLQYPLSKN
ncbi:sulfotransferase domain-containing protein [Planktomarina temperata]|nr:sulfotransferase domain-containing protein [Planktomarina temperata]